jgi:uncharacterized membrane protein (UPF0127 family)
MEVTPPMNDRPQRVRIQFLLCAIAIGLLFSGPACDRSNPAKVPAASQPGDVPAMELPRKVTMRIGDQAFTLEVAATDTDRQFGLMYRKSLPPDRGMIFVFPDAAPRSFWMRNTLIPLDILYLDETGRVVSVAQMKPLDESGVPSGGAAKYAIELNEGTAKRVNVSAGAKLDIPPVARDARN